MFDSIETISLSVATALKSAAIWAYTAVGSSVSFCAHYTSVSVRWVWGYTRIAGEWVATQATSFWGWLSNLFTKKEEAKQ